MKIYAILFVIGIIGIIIFSGMFYNDIWELGSAIALLSCIAFTIIIAILSIIKIINILVFI